MDFGDREHLKFLARYQQECDRCRGLFTACYRDKYCQECIGDLEKQHGKDKDRPLTGDLTFSALMEAIEDEEDR